MENLTLKQQFELSYKNSLKEFGIITKIVVAVKLPTEATELIINTENIEDKYKYYLNAYDDNMKLKTNSNVRIVGCMFV